MRDVWIERKSKGTTKMGGRFFYFVRGKGSVVKQKKQRSQCKSVKD